MTNSNPASPSDQASDTAKVASFKGAQFQVVSVLLLEERPLMNKELMDLTGYGHGTIKYALVALVGRQIVFKPNGRYGGWAIDEKTAWEHLPSKLRRIRTLESQDRQGISASRSDENLHSEDVSNGGSDENLHSQNVRSDRSSDENLHSEGVRSDGSDENLHSRRVGSDRPSDENLHSEGVRSDGSDENLHSRRGKGTSSDENLHSPPSPHVRARSSTTTYVNTNIKDISDDQVVSKSKSNKRTRRFSKSKKIREKQILDSGDNTVGYWLLKGNIGFESSAWYDILDKVADRDDRVHHVQYHTLEALFQHEEYENERREEDFKPGFLVTKLMDGDPTPPERCEKCLELKHDGPCKPKQVASPFKNYTLSLEDSEKAKNNPPREDETPAEYEKRLDITLKSKNTQKISGDYDDIIKR